MTAHDALEAAVHARLHPAPGPRYYVVSEPHGLVGTADTGTRAEWIALVVAVQTARTVYVHDRETEVV